MRKTLKVLAVTLLGVLTLAGTIEAAPKKPVKHRAPSSATGSTTTAHSKKSGAHRKRKGRKSSSRSTRKSTTRRSTTPK